MNSIPKILITLGAVLMIIGVLWAVLSKFINIGKLPGDIVVERENFKFYFPVVTCLVISVILSVIMYLIRFFK
ncbi:Protein of unknown function [Paenibacillus sp. UNCCL117]|uniref:DUF2905 domain-containing protein n=1 Tax=unclassified Paenibacillus TaxID=185978 RepID=UPI0008923639|nr:MULTISPECIES: DUF2905 domain-containing protein [unclassified Paenibacillus]SDC46115.1 Protein of unknown function [Paenibacillus sp. cl123]SFW12365.1 Protein of unknown function [Paenibacillus sp. UNCCL117]